MIYAYVAAIVVMLLLIGIASVAILGLSKTVSKGIQDKTIRMISSYDILLFDHSSKLQDLKEEIEKTKPQEIKSEVIQVNNAPVVRYDSSAINAVSRVSSSKYIDTTVFDLYKTIKSNFSYKIEDILAKIPEFNQEIKPGIATKLLGELSFENICEIETLSSEIQLEVMQSVLDDKYKPLIDEFLLERAKFDAILFYDYLKSKATLEPKLPTIYVASDAEKIEVQNANIVIDHNICEGVKVEINNIIYDFSIGKKEFS